MSYIFKRKMLDKSKYSLKCPYVMKPEFIVVHNTANDASALNEISYMIGNTNVTGFHIAIDDKEVIQGIEFSRNAFHSGDGIYSKGGNRVGIGIEICYSKSGGKRYIESEENAVKYIAQLLFDYGWNISKVKSHKECNEISKPKGYSSYIKNCPHRIYDEGRWNSFKERIKFELEKLKGFEKDSVIILKEEELMNLLNNTGRKECIAMIKKGVKNGLFTSKHENVEKYSDLELISYALAYINRKLK